MHYGLLQMVLELFIQTTHFRLSISHWLSMLLWFLKTIECHCHGHAKSEWVLWALRNTNTYTHTLHICTWTNLSCFVYTLSLYAICQINIAASRTWTTTATTMAAAKTIQRQSHMGYVYLFRIKMFLINVIWACQITAATLHMLSACMGEMKFAQKLLAKCIS